MDPVITRTGYTYERDSVAPKIQEFGREPALGTPHQVSELVPNRLYKDLLKAVGLGGSWALERAYGHADMMEPEGAGIQRRPRA